MTEVNYKDSVRLPQTNFPMKGNLPQREPENVKKWIENKVYAKMIDRTSVRPRFVFQDGPPYANGGIHMGHALNKILKDITVKYRNMAGFHTPFIPGWDCHGLPIEHSVLKNLGEKAKEKSPAEIRKLCREEALKWIAVQKTQFQRLGILADWDEPYLTIDSSYEAEEIRQFAKAFENGFIYLGTKPVYWNSLLQTALADAEVEYHPHKSPSIYVKFPVLDPKTLDFLKSKGRPVSFAIWTTTPWTLPANLGICLHPDFDYGVYESGNESLVLATGLKESVEKNCGLSLKLVHSFKGADAEYKLARHPFIDRDSLIVLGDHVTLEAGTGCVHTAPGHGLDDYKVGLKYKLPILSPVLPNGTYSDEVPEFKGQHIFKANPLIIEKLKSLGLLLAYTEFEHSYPHCWRSKYPLIYRATPQWFLGLDIAGHSLRDKILKGLDSIRFYPEWGKERLKSMMEGRPDWCLSRQRIWGVPIPIYYCKKTGKALADSKIMLKVADLVEKSGLDAFHDTDPNQVIGKFESPDGIFGSEGFSPGKDILDVWFDSGVSFAAVQAKRKGMDVPADLYLEGSDQHRGWFNTSLVSSMATIGKAPYKALLTHGFVTDSQGLKLSKSKGNYTDPQEIAAKSGAEILRLWVTYEDYGQDLKFGNEILDRVTETYRKIRNTMRYLLGTCSDFNFEKDAIEFSEMTEIDQWALHRLNELTENLNEAYSNLTFHKVFHGLNNFFTVDLSATYLDILKDRLYTWKPNGKARRSSQTAIYIICDHLMRMMTPVLSFLAEEVYEHWLNKTTESVFLLDFPKPNPKWKNSALADKMNSLFEVRVLAQKKLEELRAAKTIGASLEGHLEIYCEGEIQKTLKSYKDLREFFIVSEVQLKDGALKVEAKKAAGEKCQRCWTFSEDLSKDMPHPGICPKCKEALS